MLVLNIYSITWVVICFLIQSGHTQSSNNSALCHLVASTNIEALSAEWSCDSLGEPLTNPCGEPVQQGGEWAYVYCNIDLEVEYLSTSGIGLTGTIPSGLAGLYSLQYMSLNFNDLSGSFPSELGTMHSLAGLDVSNNKLTGTVPLLLNPYLNTLELYGNSFVGTIPEMPATVDYLALESNLLTGSVPSQLCSFSALYYLNVDANPGLDCYAQCLSSVTGFVKNESLLRCKEDQDIALCALVAATNIESIAASHWKCNSTGLTATNPCDSADPWSYVTCASSDGPILELLPANIAISGTIPSQLSLLTDLTYLRLSHNELTGTIPPELDSLVSLQILNVLQNSLHGTVPPLVNFAALLQLYIGVNMFTGPIPSMPTSIRIVSLPDTTISGIVPSELCYYGNVNYLDVRTSASLTCYSSCLTSISNFFKDVGLGVCSFPQDVAICALVAATNIGSEVEGGWECDANGAPTSDPCDSWQHVTCNAAGNMITELSLAGLSLNGTLPSELGELAFLVSLNLHGNSISGTIPSEIGTMSNVTYLSLESNLLTGKFPTELNTMTNLVYLSIAGNAFDGLLPELTMSSLQVLAVNDNMFSGTIPIMPTNLQQFFVQSNLITGTVPSELCSLMDFSYLDVQFNGGLACYAPCLTLLSDFYKDAALVECAALTAQDSAICAFVAATNIESLFAGSEWSCDVDGYPVTDPCNVTNPWDYLICDSNSGTVLQFLPFNLGLTGSIPFELGYMSSLVDLRLHGNDLTSSVPSELGMMFNLTYLALNNNKFTGTIPSDIGGYLTNLKVALLSANSFHSSIPILSSTTLEMVAVDHNKFTGIIPLMPATLQNITFHSNSMSGSVPADLCGLSALHTLDVQLNPNLTCYASCLTEITSFSKDAALEECYISDQDKGFCSIVAAINIASAAQASGGWECDVDGWPTSNPCNASNPWDFVNCENSTGVVLQISIQSLGLSGTLPSELSLLTSLDAFVAYGNNLHGTIPSVLGSMQNLTYLSLDGNKLSGTVPLALGNMQKLRFLTLSYNSLHGSLPPYSASVMEILVLSSNYLTGSIPLMPPSTLQMLQVQSNSLTGSLPSELCGFGGMFYVDVELNANLTCYASCLTSLTAFYKDENLTECDSPTAQDTALCALVAATDIESFSQGLEWQCDSYGFPLSDPCDANGSWDYLICDSATQSVVQLLWFYIGVSGTIPIELGNLYNLYDVRMDGNYLSGTIPSEVALPFNLTFLSLSDNSLTGTIPPEIGLVSSLQKLVLSANSLHGAIPSLGATWVLEAQLQENSLTGTVPSLPGGLEALLLQNNLLTGSLPAVLCTFSDFTYLNVEQNPHLDCYSACLTTLTAFHRNASLTECGPTDQEIALCSLVAATNIESYFEGSAWQCDSSGFPTTEPCSITNDNWDFLQCDSEGNVLALEIEYINYFIGTIPSDLALLTLLEKLSLVEIRLSGSIPDGIFNMPLLRYLNLDGNGLTGSLPEIQESSNFSSALIASNNFLVGSVPSSTGYVTKLILDHNSLSGSLPSDVDVNMSSASGVSLSYVELSSNSLTGESLCTLFAIYPFFSLQLVDSVHLGVIPTFVGSISDLAFLNLSSNILTGTVPPISNQSTMYYLGLYQNQLTGALPIVDSSSLRTFLINSNEVSGSVPSAYCELMSLNELNVYNNPELTCFASCLQNLTLFTYDESLAICLEHDAFDDTFTSFYGDRVITFEMHANSNADLQAAMVDWQDFIANEMTPLSRSGSDTLRYFSIITAQVVHMNEQWSALLNYTKTCSDYITVQGILLALLDSENFNPVVCGSDNWGVVDGNICVNCNTNGTLCERVYGEDSVYAPEAALQCDSSEDTMTVSYFIEFADSVPEVQLVHSMKETNSSIAVMVTRSVPNDVDKEESLPSTFSVVCDIYDAEKFVAPQPASIIASESAVEVYILGSATNNATNTSLAFTFSGLIAAYPYRVVCVGMNNVQGVLTKAVSSPVIQTSCCREIIFTSAPTTLFVESTSDHPSEKFVYELPVLPESTITVTPLVYLYNESSRSHSVHLAPFVSVYPGSVLFYHYASNETLSTTGSFIIQGAAGTYLVTLGIAGANSTDNSTTHLLYSAQSVEFSILSAGSAVPPPHVKSAIISNSGATFTIFFSGATDLGANSECAGEELCSCAFSFANANLYSCSWVNNTAVVATPQAGTTGVHVPGQIVAVNGGIIRAQCIAESGCASFEAGNSTNSTLSVPTNPTKPIAVVSTPSTTTLCDNLIIDATLSSGSGGRPWSSAVWVVTRASGGNTSQVALILQQQGLKVFNLPVQISPQLLEVDTYFFTLTVTNFLGAWSTVTSQVGVIDNPNLAPAVINSPSTVSFLPSAAIYIIGSAKPTSCATSYSLQFQWVVSLRSGNSSSYIPQPGLSSRSKTPSIYSLPAFTLTAGSTYRLVLIVSSTSSSSTSVASITMVAAHGAVVVVFSGAHTRTVAVDSTTATVDASGSYDEDNRYGSSGSSLLSFQWSCKVVKPAASFGTSCSNILSSTLVAVPSIVPGSMTAGRHYQLTATARSLDGRHGTDSMTVIAAASGSPFINVFPPNVLKINPAARFTLSASLISSGSITHASWAVFSSTSGSAVSTSNSSKKFTLVDTKPPIGVNFPIIIPKNTLVPRSSYTFELTAYLASRGPSSAVVSSVVLMVNAPPISGSFAVSPLSGSPLSTLFAFTAPGWTDDAEDLPLLYDFAYSIKSSRVSPQEFEIASRSTTQSSSGVLPSGIASYNHTITCTSRVRDVYEAVTVRTLSVKVELDTSIDLGTFGSNYLNSTLSNSLDSFNIGAAVQALNAVGNIFATVNCTNAPNCSSLFRYDCDAVAHTCGGCLSGYTGVFGSSNEACTDSSTSTLLALPGETCYNHSECHYNACSSGSSAVSGNGNVSGLCLYAAKRCPSNDHGSDGLQTSVCSGHGTCNYYHISNAWLGESTLDYANYSSYLASINSSGTYSDSSASGSGLLYYCPTSDPHCSARCDCDTGYGGRSCALSDSALETRVLARRSMCAGINSIAALRDHSDLWLYSALSTLAVSFESFEISSYVNRLVAGGSTLPTQNTSANNACIEVLDEIVTILQSGVLSGSDIRDEIASQALSTFSSLVDAVSLTNASEATGTGAVVAKAISDAAVNATAVLMRMMHDAIADGETTQSISDNIRTSIQSTLLSESHNQTVQPPATENELHYESPRSSITLPATGFSTCNYDDDTSYSKFTVMQWGNNPYPNSTSLKSPLIRMDSGQNASSGTTSSSSRARTATYSIVMQLASPLSTESNTTVPACTQRDPNGGDAYIPCNCDVISYTSTNATLQCYDMSGLCVPKEDAAVSARRLATTDDDLYDTGSTSPGAEYGMLFTAVGDELSKTLTVNPFAVSLEEAAPALAFMCGIVFFFITGIVYFARWDRKDIENLKYVVNASKYHRQRVRKTSGAGAMSPGAASFQALFSPREVFEVSSQRMRFSPVKKQDQPGVTKVSSAGSAPRDKPLAGVTMPAIPIQSNVGNEIGDAHAQGVTLPSKHSASSSTEKKMKSTPSDNDSDGDPDTITVEVGKGKIITRKRTIPSYAGYLAAPRRESEERVAVAEAAAEVVDVPTIEIPQEADDARSADALQIAPPESVPGAANATVKPTENPRSGRFFNFLQTEVDGDIETGGLGIFGSPLQSPIVSILTSPLVMIANYFNEDGTNADPTNGPGSPKGVKFGDGLASPFQRDVGNRRATMKRQASRGMISEDVQYVTELNNFFADLLPEIVQQDRKTMLSGLKTAVFREHGLLAPFTFASLRVSRVSRWIGVMSDILVALFLNSLFYGIFFPQSDCYTYTDEVSCMTSGTSIATGGETTCLWDKEDEVCNDRPPPTSLTFYVMVALVIVIVQVPFSILSTMCGDIMFGRPDLSDIPIFGQCFKSTKFRAAPPVLIDEAGTRHSVLIGDIAEASKPATAKSMNVHTSVPFNRLVRFRYFYTLSSRDEVRFVIHKVSDRITHLKHRRNHLRRLESEGHFDDSGLTSEQLQTTIEFLQSTYLNPAPAWEQVLMCKHRDCEDTLTRKMELKIRKRTQKIVEDLAAIETNHEEDVQDVILLQHFILEQLDTFKRQALKKQLFSFDHTFPESVSGTHWVLSWFLMISVWLFCIYWMLTWGIRNKGDVLLTFFITFIVGFAQDAVSTQPLKTLFMFLIPSILMSEQLNDIQNALKNAFLQQRKARLLGESAAAVAVMASNKAPHRHLLQDQQTGSQSLGANDKTGKLRRKVDYDKNFAAIQHMSAACRVAHSGAFYLLPASQMLRNLTDEDARKCVKLKHENNTSKIGGMFGAILISIPAIFALMGDLPGDMAFDVILSSVFAAFMIGNEALLSVSLYAFIAFYVVVAALIAYLLHLRAAKKAARRNASKPAVSSRSAAPKVEEKGGSETWEDALQAKLELQIALGEGEGVEEGELHV